MIGERLKNYTGKLKFTDGDRYVAINLVPTKLGIEMEIIGRSEQRECLLGMLRDGDFPPGTRIYALIGEPEYTSKKPLKSIDLVLDVS